MRSLRWSLPVLAVLILAVPALTAETAPEILPLAPGATGEPVVKVLAQRADGLTLEVEIPSLESEDVALDGRAFRALDLPGGGHLGATGEPAVPTLTRLVALPAGSGVTVRVTGTDVVDLGDLPLAPMAGITAADKAGPVRFDAAAYAAAAPSVAAAMPGEPAIMHGLRVVPVTFSPVAFDPATGRTSVARRMTVEVTFAGRDDRNDKAFDGRLVPESFVSIFAAEVIGFQRDALAATGPGSYILICPSTTTASIVEPLAEWRRRQGYNVIVTTTATTGTTNSAIRSWLQAQYNSLEPPLEFVTLVGDADGAVAIPSWRESYSGYNGEGDHDYTLLDGGDVLADIHLGRLSVTSTTQLQTVVNKIVAYESAPDMSDTSWFTTAGLTGDPSSSGYSTIWVNQFVKEQLLDLNYTRIDTIWAPNYLTQMMATINQGESYFTYRGYWGMSGMAYNHIEALGNGQQLPFACILTCDTGSFWSDTTCRSEAFLRAPNGGGIASVGTATIGTHTRYNNCMFLGINNGILNSEEHRVGPALTRGKLNLYNNYYANEWQNVWVWSTWNNLMGDPATEIFTGVPASIDVAYPASVSEGANAVPVNVTLAGVPVPGARVAAYQDGTVRSFGNTDLAGDVVLDIAGAAAGDVLITVTGTNMHPHLGQVAVGAVSSSLDLDALAISEVSGNGDGTPNPGEVVDLQVTLRNNGSNAVSGGAATLSSPEAWASVQTGTASLGTVAAGGTAVATFRVAVASDAPGGDAAALRLDATGSGGDWTSLVGLDVSGPAGSFNRLTFGGAGGDFDPGESGTLRFDLVNTGDLATAGVTGTLSCNSQWITVTDASGGWGALAPGGAAAQSDLFAIDISSGCYTGHVAWLRVELDYAEGGAQVIEYPVTVGTAATGDPTGPDAYGYYAFDNDDNAPEAPVYDWVDIALTGQNTGISDTSRHDDETRSFDLPFTFTHYGTAYDRVSICSNGWLSFGDTYIKLYRNWTLPADGSPDAMVCAFWDDLAGGTVYHQYDAVNHRYIVQWTGMGAYTGSGYSGNCTFQVILHDPAYHATDTGDGLIVMQYQSVTVYGDETTYFTVGVQNGARDSGVTYVYGNNYPAGSAAVQSGRAIAFRPVVPQTQGSVQGTVTNASGGGSPIADATVTVVGAGRQFVTDAAGFYSGDVPEGVYDVAVWHPSCAADTVYDVTINQTGAAVVDFSLEDIAGPAIAGVTQLDDTSDTAGPYTVQAAITDLTGVDSYALHYTSSSAGGPFTVPMVVVDAGTGLVEADIPGQATGTRVQYWITAADDLGNTSAAPAGAPWPTYGFMVASVTTVAADDMETAGSWQVNAQGGDTATSGIWENGDPIGTIQNVDYVQPEDDHTPAPGVNCWFTGQHEVGQSVGFNDVDGGATSITSPVYDVSGLSTVEVSYWRWTSNDQGNNPGGGTWIVQASNDGGANWVDVENTSASVASWQQVAFVLNDYFATPGQLRLRFEAADVGAGSLVEAAFDDLLIAASEVVADETAPTVAISSPSGGVWGIGSTLPVAWTAGDDVGVVHVVVSLSLDGGATFDTELASGALDGALDWPIDVPGGVGSYDARVRVEVFDGQQRTAVATSGAFTIEAGTTAAPIPAAVVLGQNHPNPFNPHTVIAFSLPRAQAVTLRVYDLQGKVVRTLVAGEQPAGHHEVTWRGRDDQGGAVSSGLYFYRLTTADGDQVRKMTLLK